MRDAGSSFERFRVCKGIRYVLEGSAASVVDAWKTVRVPMIVVTIGSVDGESTAKAREG